jgi:hypothetical protein
MQTALLFVAEQTFFLVMMERHGYKLIEHLYMLPVTITQPLQVAQFWLVQTKNKPQ